MEIRLNNDRVVLVFHNGKKLLVYESYPNELHVNAFPERIGTKLEAKGVGTFGIDIAIVD